MNKKAIGPIISVTGSIISISWIIYFLSKSFQAITNIRTTLSTYSETFESVGLTDPTSAIILSGTLSIIFFIIIVSSAILYYKDIGKWVPKLLMVVIPLIWMIGRFIPVIPTQRINSPVYIFMSQAYLTAGLLSGQWLGMMDGSYLIIDSIIILIGGILSLKVKE